MHLFILILSSEGVIIYIKNIQSLSKGALIMKSVVTFSGIVIINSAVITVSDCRFSSFCPQDFE